MQLRDALDGPLTYEEYKNHCRHFEMENRQAGTVLLLLQNGRPITLLNVDYKIASKAIARQIEPTLPKLVHPDQTGFIKGRYIGENVRLK